MQTIDFRKLNLFPGASILDLGCGFGRHAHALYHGFQVRVWGLDLDSHSAKVSRNGFQLFESDFKESHRSWQMLIGNCLALPFSESTFDCVICSEVLEHLPDYHNALTEIRRILKHGGVLALSVPRFGPERICWALSSEYQLDPGGHLRIFKIRPLILEIERLGFEKYARHHAHALHSPYWWLQCFKWSERETWWPIRLYHRFLVWDLLKKPRVIRALEKMCDPFLGKSVVVYFQKVLMS